MMQTLWNNLITASQSTEVSIFLKVTIATALALLGVAAARHASAAVRHLVLAALFAFLLVLPFAASLVPAQPIYVPLPERPNASASNVLPDVDSMGSASVTSSSGPNTPIAPTIPWRLILEVTFALGLGVSALSLATGVARLHQLRGSGIPWLDRSGLLEELSSAAGIGKPLRLLLCPDLSVPVTYGYFRPAILMPDEATGWDDLEVRRALIHEIEHVRRGDWIVLMTARIACALYWPHPLVWVASRRLALEAERACDDAVVRNLETPETYAEQLLSLARRLRGTTSVPVMSMATRRSLSTRIHAILDPLQRRARLSRIPYFIATATSVALLLVFAPVRVIGAAIDGAERNRSERRSQSLRGDDDLNPLGQALFQAAEQGKIEAIRRLLDAGADPNAAFSGDGSPLIAASKGGHIEAVRLLLDRGADPDQAVSGDGSPLIAAADEGHIEVVRLLLDRRADPNVGISGDGSPLIAAAGEGYLEIVKLLLAHGAKIDQGVVGDGSPLIAASGSGQRLIINLLLDLGADIELVVPGDENPLIHACESGQLEVARDLIARGANVNARVWTNSSSENPRGELRTPLIMARRSGNGELVSFLLAAGARE